MLKYIDISFHKLEKLSIRDARNSFPASYGYLNYLPQPVSAEVIFHGDREEYETIDGIPYAMFRGSNSFFHFPFKALLHIRKQKPDVVLVQGLLYPVQVTLLRLFLTGIKCSIIVQHHAGNPFINSYKRFLQKIADTYIQRYLFTSEGNAQVWIQQEVIKNRSKIAEVLEGSTSFQQLDKETSRHRLGIKQGDIFLWVGRLYDNKDPLTVLKGFRQYLDAGNEAALYMIYQTDNLLNEVKALINSSASLKVSVVLVGKMPHAVLPLWLSAADFFILGSHYESAGYALVEAMACGCIPVVTDIPTFRKITGDKGFLFKTGDAADLYQQLLLLKTIDKKQRAGAVVQYFDEQLSFRKIAEDIHAVVTSISVR